MRRMACLGAITVTLCAANRVGAANLVSNGSFETDADRDGVPDGWSTSGHPSIKQTLESDAGREGGRSAKLICTAFEGDSGWHHVMICQVGVVGVKRGAWYRLSFWAKRAGRGPLDSSVALSNTKIWGQTGLWHAFGPGERWERFEFLFNAQADVPADASRLQFWFKGTGTLWLDDVDMAETTIDRTWHPEVPTEGVRNFIPNSSFECGAAGWGGFTPRSGSWGANLYRLVGSIDESTAVHGRKSLKIRLAEKDLPWLYFDYYDPYAAPVKTVLAANRGWFRVERGKPYVLSASMRAEKAGTAGVLGVVHAEGGFDSARVTVGPDWRRFQHAFRARGDYLHVAAGLDLQASKAAEATLWLDALQLEAGAGPSDFAPRRPVEAYMAGLPEPRVVSGPPLPGRSVPMRAWNDGERPAELTGAITVADFFDRQVGKREVSREVPPGASAWDEQGIPPSADRLGFFRRTWRRTGEVPQSIRECVAEEHAPAADSRLGMNHAYPSSFLIRRAGEAGIMWWRDWSVKWDTVEPTRGTFDFSVPDTQIDRVREAGGRVLVLFPFPSARWSSTADEKRVAVEAGGNSYLRSRLPTAFAAKDPDDFKRYIRESVRHCRDRITHYQILNEPLYTTYALPAKFGYTMADYLAHVRAVHEAAKTEQPACTIVGGIGCSPADRRTREFIEAGGLRWVDVLDVHVYAAPSQFDWLEDALRDLRALMKERSEERPVWITEFGLYADDDPATIPRRTGDATMERCGRRSEFEASCDLVRLMTMFAAHGVEKVFFHAGTAPAINQPDAGGVFFEYGGEPRKMYAAALVLSRMLPSDARFVEADTLGAGIKSYTFETAAGRFTVAWSKDGGAHPLRVPASGQALDLMGNSLAGETIEITPTPVYVGAPKRALLPLPRAKPTDQAGRFSENPGGPALYNLSRGRRGDERL